MHGVLRRSHSACKGEILFHCGLPSEYIVRLSESQLEPLWRLKDHDHCERKGSDRDFWRCWFLIETIHDKVEIQMVWSLRGTLEEMVLGLNRQRALERVSMEGRSHWRSIIVDAGCK